MSVIVLRGDARRLPLPDASVDRDGVTLAEVKAAIRAELRADGATQADLAAHVGVTQGTVSQILSGKRAGSPEVVEAMARAVGLTATVKWGDV